MKKALSVMFLIGALGTTNVMCFAASNSKTYDTTFSFSGCIAGKYRDYITGDITVTTVSKQKTWGTLYDDTFDVKLYQYGKMMDTYVGQYHAKCVGTTTNGWTNIPGGSYRIELDKNKRDGQLLEGTMKIVNKYIGS